MGLHTPTSLQPTGRKETVAPEDMVCPQPCHHIGDSCGFQDSWALPPKASHGYVKTHRGWRGFWKHFVFSLEASLGLS